MLGQIHSAQSPHLSQLPHHSSAHSRQTSPQHLQINVTHFSHFSQSLQIFTHSLHRPHCLHVSVLHSEQHIQSGQNGLQSLHTASHAVQSVTHLAHLPQSSQYRESVQFSHLPQPSRRSPRIGSLHSPHSGSIRDYCTASHNDCTCCRIRGRSPRCSRHTDHSLRSERHRRTHYIFHSSYRTIRHSFRTVRRTRNRSRRIWRSSCRHRRHNRYRSSRCSSGRCCSSCSTWQSTRCSRRIPGRHCRRRRNSRIRIHKGSRCSPRIDCTFGRAQSSSRTFRSWDSLPHPHSRSRDGSPGKSHPNS